MQILIHQESVRARTELSAGVDGRVEHLPGERSAEALPLFRQFLDQALGLGAQVAGDSERSGDGEPAQQDGDDPDRVVDWLEVQ